MTSLLHVVPDATGWAAGPPGAASEVAAGQARRAAYVRTTAESAECTCPDFCERDHGNE